jgi:hypothetical protein
MLVRAFRPGQDADSLCLRHKGIPCGAHGLAFSGFWRQIYGMKWACIVLFLGTVNALSADPAKMDPVLVRSAVAAATGGETVRIVPGASGFNLYGPGKSGSVMSSASGFTIYYNGKTSRVVPTASGWTVYSR